MMTIQQKIYQIIDDEEKDFVAINFSEYFKSKREEQNLRKVAKSLFTFLTTPDEVEQYVESNSFFFFFNFLFDFIN